MDDIRHADQKERTNVYDALRAFIFWGYAFLEDGNKACLASSLHLEHIRYVILIQQSKLSSHIEVTVSMRHLQDIHGPCIRLTLLLCRHNLHACNHLHRQVSLLIWLDAAFHWTNIAMSNIVSAVTLLLYSSMWHFAQVCYGPENLYCWTIAWFRLPAPEGRLFKM